MDPPPPRPNAPAKTKDDEEEATPAAQMRVKSARQRRKVALKPGFSQLDWIRQVRVMAPRGFGRMRGITKEELRGHKERSSAWVAVRGVVYDATPYLEFHPGGVDMILKGAGKDATSLFDKYHAWVNIDFMMQKCIVGYLEDG